MPKSNGHTQPNRLLGELKYMVADTLEEYEQSLDELKPLPDNEQYDMKAWFNEEVANMVA